MKEKNISYPVMIKSSKGCSGKGTRKCVSDEEFRLNFTSVQEEVPGSLIYLMKYVRLEKVFPVNYEYVLLYFPDI